MLISLSPHSLISPSLLPFGAKCISLLSIHSPEVSFGETVCQLGYAVKVGIRPLWPSYILQIPLSTAATTATTLCTMGTCQMEG